MEVELDQLDLRYEGLRVRSAERDRRILASLSEIGQMVPIVIVSADEPADGLVVIDGYRRVRGLRQLHRDVVQAVQWDLSEIDALLLRRSLSMGSGETSLEQAWLCQELRLRFDLSLEELALRFDRSPSWVSRRLALVGELPAGVQELIREGKIVPHAAAKHLVPLARANREDCERLAQNIASHHLSSREVGEIYAAWRDAGPAVRDHIVDDPQLFLRTRRALAEESRTPSGPRMALFEDVAAIAAISRRACRRVRDGAVAALSPAEWDEVSSALRAATAGLERLAREFREAIGDEHDRSGDEDRGLGAQQERGVGAEDREVTLDLPRDGAGCHPFGSGGSTPNRTSGAARSLS